jgi:SAM-dependent methyltransferase
MPETNSYSEQWFELFHIPIGEGRTRREVEFISAVAPLPTFHRVLDICCGIGRHARGLASLGYAVTGVDRDARAIAKGRELGGGPDYVQGDVREYQPNKSAYDLAIIMSQSFGYFDTGENQRVLVRIGAGVRRGGRVILDLWNPDFFLAHQGERILKTPQGNVREMKRMEADRLFVELTYPEGRSEAFEWQLLSSEEMRSLAGLIGLDLIMACTDFDRATNPHQDNPRIQFVLGKTLS